MVSPLVNLMKDQVDKLANLGIHAASLSEITEENARCCGRKNSNRICTSVMVMISVVSQYVIGFTCHNESMLIGLFRQTQFAGERKWLFVSAYVRGAGTRDEPLRTSAWEATLSEASPYPHSSLMMPEWGLLRRKMARRTLSCTRSNKQQPSLTSRDNLA